MDIALRRWNPGYPVETLDGVASLWNRNACARHSFYPWSGAMLQGVFAPASAGTAHRLVTAHAGGDIAGFVHVTAMNEPCYPAAGSVEALLVDAGFRGRGVGKALLAEGLRYLEKTFPDLEFIDAMGAWPCGYLYTVLADGSERSGVFADESGLGALLLRFGFRPIRKSVVMQADPRGAAADQLPGTCVLIEKRGCDTWLDRVFRARPLWDHNLRDRYGNFLSRAVFGRMAGESLRTGVGMFSLFGVNTPSHLRRKGYAARNLSLLLAHVAGLGGERVEVHVYVDNLPALALYRRLGFVAVSETTMMRKPLARP